MDSLLKITLFILLITPNFAAAEIFADEEAQVTTYIDYSSGTTTTAQLMVATKAISLNVYEVTVLFNPGTVQIDSFATESGLCESQFMIEKRIDNLKGELYLACGTTNPYVSEGTFAPVLEITYTSLDSVTESPFSIGNRTNFYIHDGKGTLASQVTLPSIQIQ